jgi:hypothetical protein
MRHSFQAPNVGSLDLLVQVLGFRVMLGAKVSSADASDMRAAVCMGPIKVSCQESTNGRRALGLLQSMRKQLQQSDASWRRVYEQAHTPP